MPAANPPNAEDIDGAPTPTLRGKGALELFSADGALTANLRTHGLEAMSVDSFRDKRRLCPCVVLDCRDLHVQRILQEAFVAGSLVLLIVRPPPSLPEQGSDLLS